MRLASIKWQALIFLSIVSILVGGCASQPLPTTLKADEAVLLLDDHASIECTVSNSTGNISYEWSCSGGGIQGEGRFVDWFPPDKAGTYTINVQVKEDDGRSGRASLTITVIDNHRPVTEDIVITAEHIYLKEQPDYYLVGKDQMYNVECQAVDEDNDNLFYAWSCDNGEISGTGAKVIWKAPNANVDTNIRVTVSDGKKGVATQDLALKVVACSR